MSGSEAPARSGVQNVILCDDGCRTPRLAKLLRQRVCAGVRCTRTGNHVKSMFAHRMLGHIAHTCSEASCRQVNTYLVGHGLPGPELVASERDHRRSMDILSRLCVQFRSHRLALPTADTDVRPCSEAAHYTKQPGLAKSSVLPRLAHGAPWGKRLRCAS